MSFTCKFKIGETVTNQELSREFICGNMGGMRRSKTTNTLVLVSDHTKGLYDDKWFGESLHYTGMGKKGDQSLYNSQNKTLAQSKLNGIEVHLFEVFLPTEYVYRGQVDLIDTPYQEIQLDDEDNLRKVWMFPIRIINEEQELPETLIARNEELKKREAKKLAIEELRKRAKLGETKTTSRRYVKTSSFIRNQYIEEYSKRRAKGKCQLCDTEAPFKDNDNRPYLECHHIEWLAKGGLDSIDNTVALCPNCHRKMHVLDSNKDKEKLLNIPKE